MSNAQCIRPATRERGVKRKKHDSAAPKFANDATRNGRPRRSTRSRRFRAFGINMERVDLVWSNQLKKETAQVGTRSAIKVLPNLKSTDHSLSRKDPRSGHTLAGFQHNYIMITP